jgi:prolyl 4-hydroxylase
MPFGRVSGVEMLASLVFGSVPNREQIVKTTGVNAEWLDWIAENLDRGCSVPSMVERMIPDGISYEAANQACYQVGELLRCGKWVWDRKAVDWSRVRPNFVMVGNHRFPVLFRLDRPEAFVLGDFLTVEECLRLRSLDGSSGPGVSGYTRYAGQYAVGSAPVADIENRIAQVIGLPVHNGEGVQVLRYPVGGEFKPHYDTFNGNDPNDSQILNGGQRVWTVIMYLNVPESGGETVFPRAGGAAVVPKMGAALFFRSSTNGVPDENSQHAGAPVYEGEKWVATKWVRERRHV